MNRVQLQRTHQEEELMVSTLQLQLSREVVRSCTYRSKWLKAQEKVSEQEAELKRAEKIIVDQQKAVDEAEKQKDQLNRINLKRKRKILNMEGGARERQREIQQLEILLRNQRQESGDWQVKWRRLRENVFKLNQELSVFLGNLGKSVAPTVFNQGNASGAREVITVKNLRQQMQPLTHLARSKFIAIEKMQLETRAELAKTNSLVEGFSKLISFVPATSQLSLAPITLGPVLVNPPRADIRKQVPPGLKFKFNCHNCGEIFASKRVLIKHWMQSHLSHPQNFGVPEIAVPPDLSEQLSPLFVTSNITCTSPGPTPNTPKELLFYSGALTFVPPPENFSPTVASLVPIKTEATGEGGKVSVATTPQKFHGIDRTTKARRRFLCLCGRSSSSEKHLRRHISYYSSECYFGCSECSRRFKFTSEVRKHMKSVHKMDYTLKGCRQCGALFVTMAELAVHQALHKHRREQKMISVVDLTNIPGPSQLVENQGTENELPIPQSEVTPLLRVTSARETALGNDVMGTLSCTTSKRTTIPIKIHGSNILSKKHGIDQKKRHLGHFCLCGVKRSCARGLTNHILYFMPEGKHKCQVCSQSFVFPCWLKAHMASKHKMPGWGSLTSDSGTPSRDATSPPRVRPTVIRGPSITISTRGASSQQPMELNMDRSNFVQYQDKRDVFSFTEEMTAQQPYATFRSSNQNATITNSFSNQHHFWNTISSA